MPSRPSGAGTGPGAASARVISRNTTVQVVAEIAGKLLTLAFYVYMARRLGSDGFGDFVFALSLALLTTVIAGFGTDTILTREIARDRDRVKPLFWNVIGIKVAFGVIGIGLALTVSVLGGYGADVRAAVALLATAAVLELLAKTVGATFQAFDDMRPFSLALLIERLFTAAVGILALVAGVGVVAVAAIYLGGAAVSLLYIGWRLAARRLGPRLGLSSEHARWLFLASLPIGLSVVFNTVVFRADATILSLYKGNADVGLYGAAYQLLESTLFLSYAFVAAILPTLSRLGRDTRPSIATAYEGSCKVIAAMLLPLGAGFVLFAEPVMRTLYGEGYVDAASAAQLLGGAAMLYGLSYLSSYVLISQGRQRLIAWVTAAVAIENVGLNVILIPDYSFDGAAAVTSISEATLAISLTVLAIRATGPISPRRILLGPGIASAGMALVALAVGTDWVGLVAAAATYLVLLAALERWLHPADFALAVDSIRRQRAPVIEVEADPSRS